VHHRTNIKSEGKRLFNGGSAGVSSRARDQHFAFHFFLLLLVTPVDSVTDYLSGHPLASDLKPNRSAIDTIDRWAVSLFALTFSERSSCLGSNPGTAFIKRWLMNTYIPLILTAIVTISTIIYTIFSIQLWRTSRAAAEISRQAAFGNLWAELNRYLEILRQQEAPETAFLQKVSDLLLEFMIANLVTHATEKNDKDFEEFRRKLLAASLEHETVASKIPWVARLVEQRKRH
jgi:hypothetical protein